MRVKSGTLRAMVPWNTPVAHTTTAINKTPSAISENPSRSLERLCPSAASKPSTEPSTPTMPMPRVKVLIAER